MSDRENREKWDSDLGDLGELNNDVEGEAALDDTLSDILDEVEAVMDHNFDRLLDQLPDTLESEMMERVDSLDQLLSPFAQLELLYQALGELTDYVENIAPCHKGCAYCCHYNIPLSTLEVAYIEAKTGIQSSASEPQIAPSITTTNTTLTETDDQTIDPAINESDYSGTPCPFLKENICSIYDARPFACREYYSLADDPKWCAVEIGIEMALLQLPPIEMLRDKILPEPIDAQRDIREYFG